MNTQYTNEVEILAASDKAASDTFGISVDISGDTAIVGAYLKDPSDVDNAGSAYIYVRRGDTWIEQAILTASDKAIYNYFGHSVAISGNTAIVGAYGRGPAILSYEGAAYIYVRTGNTWTEQTILTASDKEHYDHFGSSVDISGDTAIVGATNKSLEGFTDAGSAYIYVRTGTTWTEQAILTASDKASHNYFGASVTISGDTVIVGATGKAPAGLIKAGGAYIYQRTGTTWSEQAILTASDKASHNYFGISVDISGDTAIVGAYCKDTAGISDTGGAYIYQRIGTTWSEQAILTASDKATGNYFGYSVAILEDTAIVSAHYKNLAGLVGVGGAYIYQRTGTTWTEQTMLTASDKAIGDNFGNSIAMSGNTTIIGAYCKDIEDICDAGGAYIFT